MIISLSKKSKQKEQTIKIIEIVCSIIVALISLFFIIYCNIYTAIPNIKGLSAESAKGRIYDALMEVNMEDFKDSDNKLVWSISIEKDGDVKEAEAGDCVKQHTTIRVKMLDKDSPKFYEQVVPEKNYLKHKDNYQAIIDSSISSFNTNKLELSLSDIGVLLHAENDEYSSEIGQERIVNANVSLINIYNDKIIDEKISDIEGNVVFENIPDGTYIYKIEREGYETLVSEIPFKLAYDSTKNEDFLVWSISMENDSVVFSNPKFRIKIVDNKGNAVKGESFDVRPIKDEQRNSFSSIPVVTDESGYLTLWHSEKINNDPETDYYDMVTFELEQKYQLDIVDSDGNYKTIDGNKGKTEYIICFD